MFNIIPNWHPIFVHFTIGLLLTTASILLIVSGIVSQKKKVITLPEHITIIN